MKLLLCCVFEIEKRLMIFLGQELRGVRAAYAAARPTSILARRFSVRAVIICLEKCSKVLQHLEVVRTAWLKDGGKSNRDLMPELF